jgi:hypothetical protein
VHTGIFVCMFLVVVRTLFGCENAFDVITSLVSLEHGVYGWEKVTSHREVSSKCAA